MSDFLRNVRDAALWAAGVGVVLALTIAGGWS
jgi:hypothetical protein